MTDESSERVQGTAKAARKGSNALPFLKSKKNHHDRHHHLP